MPYQALALSIFDDAISHPSCDYSDSLDDWFSAIEGIAGYLRVSADPAAKIARALAYAAIEEAGVSPATPGPLPRPLQSAETPHRVTFPLSQGEFACLSALADRWDTTPDLAACTALCLDLEQRYRQEAAPVSRHHARTANPREGSA